MIRVLFEVVQEYYWTSMEPIYRVLAQDPRYELSLRIGPNHSRFLGVFLVSHKRQIEDSYIKDGYNVTDDISGFDVVITGDTIKNPEEYGNALLCNVDHGPCIKTLRYRNLLKQENTKYIVFAEGKYRIEKLKKYGLDKKHKIIDIGLPKHDPLFNNEFKREEIVKRYNLDPSKKIIVYAPSYKPTSIFMVGDKLPLLLDKYNVLVKLHPYSWAGKYASHAQHRFFEKLCARYPQLRLVHRDEYNILPYLFVADTMISEGSSVINEFLALGRCGIIVNLPDEKLCHSDGQPHLEENSRDWLKESFVHLNDPEDLVGAVEEALYPDASRLQALERDKKYIYTYTDGKSSIRLKAAIEELLQSQKCNSLNAENGPMSMQPKLEEDDAVLSK